MSVLRSLARRPHQGRRRIVVGTCCALIVTLLALGSVGGAIAAQRSQQANDPSPAQGRAQVVAQGVAPLPAGQVAWRVSRATAAPRGATSPAALGFVLADADALLINDLQSGSQARLAAGEAAFVQAASQRQAIALGDAPVAYYRLDLLPEADAASAGDDDLIASSDAFAAPDGNRDLDLVRATLERNEVAEFELGTEEMPAVLLVTSGAFDVAVLGEDSASATSLAAGEAASVAGTVTVRAVNDGATFVAAVVGPAVPAIERAGPPPPPATPRADTASIVVEAFGCPVAYPGDDFAADCTEALADIEFRLAIPATEFSVAGTTAGDGAVAFDDLGENTYLLAGGVPAEFAVQIVVCADADGPIPTDPTGSEIPGALIDLPSGAEITCSWYVVPEDLQGGDTGSIALAVKLCPTADTPLDSCDFGDVTAPLTFSGPVQLSTAGGDVPVRIHGPSYVWGEEGGIPFGAYYLPVDMPAPDGFALDRVAGSAGGSGIGYAVFVDAETPNALVYLVYVRTDAGGPDLGNDGVDYDCGDFPELNAAQGYFAGDGGSAARNVDDLDGNRNGAACELGDDPDSTPPTPPADVDLGNDGVDMDCGDFVELNAAQGYFAGDGGSAERNVDAMDANRNGAACEPGDDSDTTEPVALTA